MRIAVSYLAILSLLGCSVLGTPTNPNVADLQPLDMFNTLLNAPEYIQGIVTQLFTFITLGNDDMNTITFQNFTYDHSFLFRDGQSHTYNPTLSGLSGMKLQMSIDDDTKEVRMDITIPEATFLGTYDLHIVNIGWPFPGDTHFHGAGNFNHTFYDLNFAINYTLIEDQGLVKAANVSPLLKFGHCTIWAENYTVNGWNVDWVQISKEFKVDFDNAKPKYDVILKESIAWSLNVPWGVLATEMEVVLALLHTIADAWQDRVHFSKEALIPQNTGVKAQPLPRDYFNVALNAPEFMQGVVTQFFNFVMLRNDIGSVSFQNYTYNHAFLLVDGESNTFNPILAGLTGMELTMKIDNDTKNVMMDAFIPVVTYQGQYDLWVDERTLFPEGVIRYRGEGGFGHKFYDVHFAVNYTLVEDDGRVKATNISPLLQFTQCILWAENYYIDGRHVEDFFEISRNWKRSFDEDKVKYEVILQESIAWALNIPWGVMDMSMDNVLSILHGLITDEN